MRIKIGLETNDIYFGWRVFNSMEEFKRGLQELFTLVNYIDQIIKENKKVNIE